jgi:hypothetical protein
MSDRKQVLTILCKQTKIIDVNRGLLSISGLFWLISILYFLELSGSGGVGLLVRCKRVFGDAGKSKLSEDIVKIINEKTAPLITKIDNLEKREHKAQK